MRARAASDLAFFGVQLRKLLLWVWLAFAPIAFNTALADTQLHPLAHQSVAAHLSAEVLSRYLYEPFSLDDAASSRIFDNYLKILDGDKLYFLQSDIDQLGYARTTLDDAILHEDLTTPFAIFNLYHQRAEERLNFALSLLDHGFGFERQEGYQYNRKHASWAKSVEELNDLWRKRVKNDWLRLKLAGKDGKTIADTLRKRYDNALKGWASPKATTPSRIS